MSCNPDFLDFDTEVVVDQLVAHPGNVLPRPFRMRRPEFAGEPTDGLFNGLKLADNSILDQGGTPDAYLIEVSDVPFHITNPIEDVSEIRGVPALHGQSVEP